MEDAQRRLRKWENDLVHGMTRRSADYSVFYWLAQIDYILAESYLLVDNKRNATRFFESAFKHSVHSVRQRDNVSDVHRMMGECIGRLIPLKGWLFAMAKAKQALEAIEMAITLDKGNGLAYVTLSTYYLFTPPLFGGSVEKAIESLEQAFARSLTQHGNFLAHFWMAYALSRQEEKEQAHHHLAQALSIYPNNRQALFLLNHLKRCQPPVEGRESGLRHRECKCLEKDELCMYG